MPRSRRKKLTLGKTGRQMSRTLLDDNVTLTVSIIAVVVPTINCSSVGTGDVFENADTVNIVTPSAVIKYINMRLESGVRDVAPSAPGFVEYALVVFDEMTTTPTVASGISTNIGTQTLGTMARNFYRGKVLWEDAFRVSRELPEVANIKIKLPPWACQQKIGRYFMLLKAFRTNDVSDATSDCRTWYSHSYKAWT